MATIWGLIIRLDEQEDITIQISSTLFFGGIGSKHNKIIFEDAEIYTPKINQSALESSAIVDRILRKEKKILKSIKLLYQLVTDHGNHIDGRSADLAFAMAYAIEVVKQSDNTRTLPDIAATGKINKKGQIEAIQGINQKVQAALKILPVGSQVYYPEANHQEIATELHQQAREQQIELIAVNRLEAVLKRIGIEIEDTYLGEPYRGLDVFEYEHSAIFCGREVQTQAICDKMFERAEAGHPNLIIIGASGSGKSSIILAGVMPWLINRKADLSPDRKQLSINHSQWAKWRPRDSQIHLTPIGKKDPTKNHSLSEHKSQKTAKQQLIDSILRSWTKIRGIDVEKLTQETPIDSDTLLKSLNNALIQNSNAQNKIIWVLDQLEELYTQDHTTETIDWFSDFIKQFNKAGHWVIATLRNDFFPHYQQSSLVNIFGDDAHHTLKPPAPEAIEQIIKEPARKVGLAFEIDAKRRSLAFRIQNDVGEEVGVLPLLEFALDQLYRNRDEKKQELTYQAYLDLGAGETGNENCGGLKGVISHQAELRFNELSKTEQLSFPKFIRRMVNINLSENQIVTSKPVLRSVFSSDPEIQSLIQTFVKNRLLIEESIDNLYESQTDEAQDNKNKQQYSTQLRIVHDALLNHWPRAQEIIQENLKDIQLEAKLKNEAKEWGEEKSQSQYSSSEEKEKVLNSFLIIEEKKLTDAKDFLNRLREELDKSLIDYIERSSAFAKRNKRKRFILLGGLSVFLLMVSLVAGYNKWEAKKQLIETNHNYGVILIEKAKKAVDDKNFQYADIFFSKALLKIKKEFINELVNEFNSIGRKNSLTSMVSTFNTDHESIVEHITALSYSPNGLVLASASSAHIIKLWDVKTNALIKTLSLMCCYGSIESLEFSSDGLTLTSRTSQRLIKWDVKTSTVLHNQKDHNRLRLSTSYSPDGLTLAGSSMENNNILVLWDVKTKSQIQVLGNHDETIGSVKFSPDGLMLASRSRNKIKLWDIEKGTQHTFNSEKYIRYLSFSFSPDGLMLASISNDNVIKLWDTKTGILLHVQVENRAISTVIFSPDGLTMTTGSGNGATAGIITHWAINKGSLLHTLEGAGNMFVSDYCFSSDGLILAGLLSNGIIKLWDIQTGTLLKSIDTNKSFMGMVKCSPNDFTLASGGDHSIKLWDIKTGDLLKIFILEQHDYGIKSIFFSQDNSTLIGILHDDTIKIWDIKTGDLLKSYNTHQDYRNIYSPDGSTLASVLLNTRGKTIKIMDIKTGDLLHMLKENFVTYSPNGLTLASFNMNELGFKVWDVQTGDLLQTLGEDVDIDGVIFSSDGLTLISSSWPADLSFWNIKTGNLLQIKKNINYGHHLNEFVRSPNGLIFAAITNDNIDLLDATTGALLYVLDGHNKRIDSISFSPDSSILASRSRDRTIKLWDMNIIKDRLLQLRKPEKHLIQAEEKYFSKLDDSNIYLISNKVSFYKQQLTPKWLKTHPFFWGDQAKSGVKEAMYELSLLYERYKNSNSALKWLNQAAKKGHKKSIERLTFIKHWHLYEENAD